MTLEEAMKQVKPGGSVEQTFWTQHPESAGVEPEPGMEYQVKVTVTKEEGGTHKLYAQVLDKRNVLDCS